jgi:hypothetical protein
MASQANHPQTALTIICRSLLAEDPLRDLAPEVAAVMTVEPPVELGVRCFRLWLFWLRQGEWDG